MFGPCCRGLLRGPRAPWNAFPSQLSASRHQLHNATDKQRRMTFQQFINRENAPFTGSGQTEDGVQSTQHQQQWSEGGRDEKARGVPRRHVLDLIEVRPTSYTLEECGSNMETQSNMEKEETETSMDPPRGASSDSSPLSSNPGDVRRRHQHRGGRNEGDPQARGRRDLHLLRTHANGRMRIAKQRQLREECKQALSALRDVLTALQAATHVPGLSRGSHNGPVSENHSDNGAGGGQRKRDGRMVLSEAVRFQRLQQLRDATSLLTTAHFLQVPKSCILEFLDVIGRIVTVVGNTPTAPHSYVVRQAVKALFAPNGTGGGYALGVRTHQKRKQQSPPMLNSRQEALQPVHLFRLLRSMLTLPSEDSLQMNNDGGASISIEEFCVRQLYRGNCNATSSAGGALLKGGPLWQLGPARAVRVVSWCMRCSSTTCALSVSQRSTTSLLPPISELRIPFDVGKEYTQTLLACFAQPMSYCGRESHKDSSSGVPAKTLGAATEGSNESFEPADGRSPPERLPFTVKELAVLCSAIVYYKVTTMEALNVLITAAPLCALHADELTGHELSCVLLAYATLKYHGDLTRHTVSAGMAYPSSRCCRAAEEKQTNFYLLLGERVCDLGEKLNENDAARALHALELSGVEHETLRNSLMSGMRMKRLRCRVLLAGT